MKFFSTNTEGTGKNKNKTVAKLITESYKISERRL